MLCKKYTFFDDIVESINNLEEKTKNNTGLNFTIAINYGGRDEIVRAVQKIAQDVKEGKIAPEAIDEAMINANLDTKDIPDPDLLIQNSTLQMYSGRILIGKNLLRLVRNIIKETEDMAELRRNRIC